MNVRRAATHELEAVVGVLVRSHLDYVWERWAIPGADRAERLSDLYRVSLETIGFPAGEVWVDDELTSAAVWLNASAMGGLNASAFAAMGSASAAAFGERAPIVDEVDALVSAARPEAQWYLATMGTDPAFQGQGRGSAVLGPRLEALATAGERAVLETSDERNVRFYERLGFEVATTLDALPYEAPSVWVMQRG